MPGKVMIKALKIPFEILIHSVKTLALIFTIGIWISTLPFGALQMYLNEVSHSLSFHCPLLPYPS